MKQAELRKILSGQASGIYPALLRIILRLPSLAYSAAIRLRNFFYDKHVLKSHRVNITVISIGNLTAGGTGKTPVVAWLTKQLCGKYKCAILTRGYKSTANGSDEVNTLAQISPEVPVIINPDRLKGAKEAMSLHGADVLIMDDGFQHRRLARDIDILSIDATCPFGYGKILPAGFLREPVGSVKRAHSVIITRCDQVNQSEIDRIENELLSINPKLTIVQAIHKPQCIITSQGDELKLEQLKGQKVFTFCGIGNPAAFFRTVKSLGAKLADRRIFDDHYNYKKEDIEKILAGAEKANVELVLTTEKDFIKIKPEWRKSSKIKIAYLAIEIELIKDGKKITELIEKALESKIG
ncbi:MAG: tetraacyldisaccharide 4'-kinase [Sedimentisphaerales bacterium]|nr:tetraacyldisaccharide 4'-kinase [Sedimentisphaerales bacterium]